MKRFGFRARLTAAIALLIAAVTGFFSFYVPRSQETAADEGLRTRAVNLGRVLASLVAPALEFDSPDEAQRQLLLVRDDHDLVRVVAFDDAGRVVANYRAPGAAAPDAAYAVPLDVDARATGDQLTAVVPLRSTDDRVIGGLELVMSRASVVAARTRSQRNAVLVSAIILLLGIVVARLITRPLVGTAVQLASVSESLIVAAREQETSAAQEGAAVEETRLSMETLLSSAQEIANRSSEVLGNSERSMSRNREIAQKIGELGAMLESIMQIADKTDLLALNAALEGTRAGEAGKGFALVAAEMRRLAENVMGTAEEIRQLIHQMHAASESAVDASREGTVSSEKIALLTQQQKQATEAVIVSMDEMTNVLNQTLAGIQRSTQSANTLADLARVLTGMIGRPGAVPTDNPAADLDAVA